MKICPETGSEGCMEHDCLFFDKVPATGDYMCRSEITNGLLNEVAQELKMVLRSNEQHRAMQSEVYRSAVAGKPTDELQRLIGLDDIPRVDLPPR